MQDAGWTPESVGTGAETLAHTGVRIPDRRTRSESVLDVKFHKFP
jgi:hypothetical protein